MSGFSAGKYVRVFLRSISNLSLMLFFLAFVWGCGGGGGGGGDDGGADEPAPAFPSIVQYSAGSPADFGGSGVTLALEGGGSVTAGFYLEGLYAGATRTYTLTPHSVPRMTVTTSGLPYSLLYPDFGILVEQPLQWQRGMHPTAGQFRTVPGDTVRVTVTADAGGSGQPGVDIEWIVAEEIIASDSLVWGEFDGVLGNQAAWDDHIVMAAFEFRVLQWLYDQIQLGMDGIEFVTTNDAALSSAGSGVGIDRSCDLLPYAGQAGSLSFTWNDGPGEFADALGAGDSFEAVFSDCWKEEAGDSSIWVRSGTAGFLAYWEDPATITLGFVPVVLNDVVETAVMEQGASYTLGETITVNSFGSGDDQGFRLIIEPDASSGINLTNAVDLASMGIEALFLPPEVGDVALGLLTGFVSDPSFNLCDISGSVSISPMPTPATAVPASFDVGFSSCRMDPTDPVTINGSISLVVEDAGGGTLAALTGDDFNASLTIAPIAVDSTDDVGTGTLTGGTRFSRTAVAGNYTETSEAVAGGLSVAEDGFTQTLQAYRVMSAMDTGGQYSYGAAGDLMTLNLNDPSGTFTLAVIQALQGSDSSAPLSGEIRIGALDGSTLTMTVNNGLVTLGLDTDGDGAVDDTLVRDWDDIY